MKKLFTLFLALIVGVGTIYADAVKIGDLYYNLNEENMTAEVTYEKYGSALNYSGFTKIVIPSSVTYNSVTYSVTSIGGMAFSGCENMRHIVLPSSLQKIGRLAFESCPLLQTIHIPANVQTIEMPAFVLWDWDATEEKPFSNFKSFTVDENNQYFTAQDGVLFNKAMTQLIRFPSGKSGEYTVPNTVESISQYAFYYIMNVPKVTILDNVLHLGEVAFGYNFGLDCVIVGNGVKRIPYGCFIESGSLQYVSLGTGVKEIANTAFGMEGGYSPDTYLPLSTILCYSQQVPEIIKVDAVDNEDGTFYYSSYKEEDAQDVFFGINRDTKIYVQGNLISDYKKHFVWREFDVQPITVKETETTDVQTIPTDNSVDVAWPVIDGAYTYELVIRDKDDNIVCTLIFNAQGQLTSIAFNAPARDDAPQKTQTAGFSFTVTGLEAGTEYDLTITAKNENGQEIDKKNVSFHTNWPNGIEDIYVNSDKPAKVLNDGKVYILCGEKVYTVQGQEVKR